MTDIAKTSSITLITGLPGSGKTLRVVHWVEKAISAGEIVFVSNLNGLKVSHIPFEDPRKWRELPAGSVLVVDEAQMFFRTRRGGDAPDYITAMETIRHDGVRLILTTQQPDYLDSHLRGLVGLHEHLVRENGKQAVKIYRHGEVMDNVRSAKARARYDTETWQYPKRIFSLYQSAEVHTVKPTMKARFKRGLVMGGIAVSLIGYGVYRYQAQIGDQGTKSGALAGTPAAAGSPGGAAGGPAAAKSSRVVSALSLHEPAALEEYFARLRPRAQQLPWSAPIYDDRPAASEPRVFCIEGGAGVDASGEHRAGAVTCMTEQGSRVVMADNAARMLARWGEPYNPFKRAQAQQQAASRSESHDLAPVVPVVVEGPAAGAGTEPPPYGGMRDVRS